MIEPILPPVAWIAFQPHALCFSLIGPVVGICAEFFALPLAFAGALAVA